MNNRYSKDYGFTAQSQEVQQADRARYKAVRTAHMEAQGTEGISFTDDEVYGKPAVRDDSIMGFLLAECASKEERDEVRNELGRRPDYMKEGYSND